MTLILGIDDAGRGPVLGPMILAGVLIGKKDNNILKKWGAKDSKILTPTTRKKIKKQIIEKFKHNVEISTPKEIDKSTNLNNQETIKYTQTINTHKNKLNKQIKAIQKIIPNLVLK